MEIICMARRSMHISKIKIIYPVICKILKRVISETLGMPGHTSQKWYQLTENFDGYCM